MFLFIIAALASIASPFVVGILATVIAEKLRMESLDQKRGYLVSLVFLALTLGLPGSMMSVFGFISPTTSLSFFVIGIAIYLFGLVCNSGNQVESWLVAVLVTILLTNFAPFVESARQEQLRKQAQERQAGEAILGVFIEFAPDRFDLSGMQLPSNWMLGQTRRLPLRLI